MSEELPHEAHPDPDRFWRRLYQIMLAGIVVVLSTLVIAAWAYVAQERDSALPLLEACAWIGFAMVLLYGCRDAVQSFIERKFK